MRIGFTDFVPRQIAPAGVLKMAEYETFDAAVAAANDWIQKHGVKVVNVETVCLPNIWVSQEAGNKQASLGTPGNMWSSWHQFVRVWHRLD